MSLWLPPLLLPQYDVSIIGLVIEASLPPFAFGDRLQSFSPILYHSLYPCFLPYNFAVWADDLLSLLTLGSVMSFSLAIGCLGKGMQAEAWNGLAHWGLLFCQEKNDRMTDTWHWLWCSSQAHPRLEPWKIHDTSPEETSRATQLNPPRKSRTLLMCEKYMFIVRCHWGYMVVCYTAKAHWYKCHLIHAPLACQSDISKMEIQLS